MPTSHRSVDLTVAIGMWNLAWEAGQFRRRFFDPDELPEPLAKLAELGDRNIQFVSKIRSKSSTRRSCTCSPHPLSSATACHSSALASGHSQVAP